MFDTPIELLNEKNNSNHFFIKRDDLLPFCFGGNKARKAEKFKSEIIKNKNDVVITYGSSSSNHCRIIANMCKMLNLKCFIVSPIENYKETYNSKMIKMFDAEIIKTPIDEVSQTINDLITRLSKTNNPYFIPGGGHGNLGTEAYVDCYNEILNYETNNNIFFDYIFFATGTGTTQAGLVCGQYLNKDFNRKIIGISIARDEKKGKKIVVESIKEYLKVKENEFINLVEFSDKYTDKGYGVKNIDVLNTIKKVLVNNGIALNSTYTGKAYYGMIDYIKLNNIKEKNILFINTGGLPLFFDDIGEIIK